MSSTTETFAAADPGATAIADIQPTLDHLNDNHADTVLFLARHVAAGPAADGAAREIVDAELSRVERTGAVFAVRAAGDLSELRLTFEPPVATAEEARAQLFAVLGVARAAAPVDAALTSLEHELQITASLSTVHGRVSASERVAPNLLQLTIDGLGGSPYDGLTGGDAFAYVMISHQPGGISPAYGMDAYREQDPDDPVRGAYYTVRRSRPEVGEIDVWAVVHDHPGTVSEWMSAAVPGDPVALWGPRHGFRIPDDVAHLLLVADESGLAAVAALIETLPTDRRATAVLECVDAAHRPPMPEHAGLTIVWVDRGADEPGAVNRLLDAVAAEVDRHGAEGVPGPDAAFGAAESRQISAVRRHIRTAVGVPAARVLMTGYWRRQGH